MIEIIPIYVLLADKTVDLFSTMYSKILEFASVKTLKRNILKTFTVQLVRNSFVWIDCFDLFTLSFSLSIFSSVEFNRYEFWS